MLVKSLFALCLLSASASAFVAPAGIFGVKAAGSVLSMPSRSLALRGGAAATKMADITPNVSFDTIAREWRCKWSADEDKASLSKAQDALTAVIADVKKVKGVKSVQVVTALDAGVYGDWEAAKFAPEEKFLADLKAIKGISQVETQTYTIMPM